GAVRLGRRLRPDLFAAAVARVVARHESLRTSFGEIDGEPAQTIGAEVRILPRQIDLSALPNSGAETLRLGSLQLAQPFDLGRPPLLRLWLVRLGAEDALLYAIHHIISDAWSLGLLVSEITAGYAALAAGQTPVLPELPVQYADFAAWQRSWFDGGELDRQLGYWRDRLAGAQSTELPTDRPRPAVSSYRGRGLRTAIGPELAGGVARIARGAQASAYMVLLAAFETVAVRYGAGEDVVLGTPIANRERREVERLIGFFVNTLVLRTDLSGDPSFGEALARTKEAALGAFAHQDMPFERLVEELAPVRDLARNPFFQLMFNLINTPAVTGAAGPRRDGGAGGETEGAGRRSLDVQAATALFDLQLYLVEASDSFLLYWEYASDLFEEATIRRLARAYETLLGAATARPEARLSELPLLSPAERAELVAAGAGQAADGPGGLTHERIAAQALRTPGAIAVAAGADVLTYAELAARANRLSRRLRRLGVGVESRVGIAVDRSLALPVAALGVMGAGAAYVPLDPAYPAERLAYMAADAGLAALIVDGDLLDREAGFSGYAPVQVRIGPLGDIDGDEEATPFACGVGAENLAYTIYTSGSTGKPKGVELSHGALANFLDAMTERPGIAPSDVLVSVTSLSFDIAGLELYGPLRVGARTVIARREETLDGRLLAGLLERSGATMIQATPSGWRVLLASGWAGRGLKALVGGEALPPALAAELAGKVGSLWNMYGPTETAVWSTLDRVEAGPISIGRPIAATGTYVVDRFGDLLPAGVPGELWIGGAGVARGYHARPDLTAERFVPDAFSGEAGARLYRTGDLARWWSDGRLECLGRLDTQVKVRGHRIELGEIESVLGSHPGVAAAAVTVFGEGEDRRLAAYVVEREAAEVLDDLGSYLRARLPESMLPSVFIRLDALPLTPNGKVDKKALPKPEFEIEAGTSTPPRTPLEREVAAIWEGVLGVSGLGVESHFFALGGHSLLAMRLSSRLREAFGLELPLRTIFETPTLGA